MSCNTLTQCPLLLDFRVPVFVVIAVVIAVLVIIVVSIVIIVSVVIVVPIVIIVLVVIVVSVVFVVSSYSLSSTMSCGNGGLEFAMPGVGEGPLELSSGDYPDWRSSRGTAYQFDTVWGTVCEAGLPIASNSAQKQLNNDK